MARATITVEGYVAKDPETRQVTGHSITAVSIPVTPQKKDGNGGYVDSGETVWYSAEFWDDHGAAVAQAVRKRDLVTVTGNLDITVREKDGRTYVNQIISFGSIAVVVPRKAQRDASSVRNHDQASRSTDDDSWRQAGSYSDETPF